MTLFNTPPLYAGGLLEVIEEATSSLRTVGHPGSPFGAPTRIEEARLLRAMGELITELGTQLRAREIASEAEALALAKPAKTLADVLSGPDLECRCEHEGPGDHRSDGCAWSDKQSGVGCDCNQRGGIAPIATRIWFESAAGEPDFV